MISGTDIADFIEINGMLINPKQNETIDKANRQAIFTSGFRMQFSAPDFNKLMKIVMPTPVVATKKAAKK